MPHRGAKVLHAVLDTALLNNADVLKYCCQMNMENWAYVPPHMQSDDIFHAMLQSPFNAPGAKPCPPLPLVLQLGLKQDCDNIERVWYAVRHSGYNFQFASKRVRGNACILAWAAATEDIKSVTKKDANRMYKYKLRALNVTTLPYDMFKEKWREWVASLSLEDRRMTGDQIYDVRKDKAAAYFAVPEVVRELLWPGHTSDAADATGLRMDGESSLCGKPC
jgi:hypothetical protein